MLVEKRGRCHQDVYILLPGSHLSTEKLVPCVVITLGIVLGIEM